MKNEEPKEFWITNTSKMDVMIGDLGFCIKSYKSANLLDKKHFHFTWDQIFKSATTGSIFNKRKKIAIRQFAPRKDGKKIALDVKAVLEARSKSIFEIKQEKFAELDLTDEEFAEEISE